MTMAARLKKTDNKKRNISSDSSFELGKSDQKSKPESKKVRQDESKDMNDQTYVTRFTKSSALSEASDPDIKTIMAQLKIMNEKLISREDLKAELENTKTDILTRFEERLDKLELRILTGEIENDKLKKENMALKTQCNKMLCDVNSAVFSSNVARQKIDELEQHTRKNSIRIFGVADKNKTESAEQTTEATVGVMQKIGVSITKSDIDIAHRLGKFTETSARPIIVKFVSRLHKQQAIYNRRKLKGSGIGLSEDLTVKNRSFLKELQEDPRVNAAWTRDTNFFVKLKSDDRVIRVNPAQFLHKNTYDSDTENEYS